MGSRHYRIDGTPAFDAACAAAYARDERAIADAESAPDIPHMTYYISGGADPWIATRARTLRGAMLAAARAYHLAHGGVIKIAIERDGAHETIATRYGYSRWMIGGAA